MSYDWLNNKSKIDSNKIKTILVRTISYNLTQLSQPCFQPSLKGLFYQLLSLSNLTETNIREYTKLKWKGRKEATYLLHSDHISNFYIFLMTYALKNNDKQLYQFLVTLYIFRQYMGVFKVFFPKYCDDSIFKRTLEIMTKTHLFSREQTVGNAIYFIAKGMFDRFDEGIKNDDLDTIAYFITDGRTRIFQSMRSFAETYYKTMEDGGGLETSVEPMGQEKEEDEMGFGQKSTFEQEKTKKIADNISKRITIYKEKDIKALENAKKITKIPTSIAAQIIIKLSQLKHTSQLQTIIVLYLKSLTSVSQICGNDFKKQINNLMMMKRSKSQLFFKSQIIELLESVLHEIDYLEKYNQLQPRSQYNYKLFIAFYLGYYIRNSICVANNFRIFIKN